MNDASNNFLEYFRPQLLDDDTWHRYVSYFTKTTVPANTVLLREGETSTKAYLVEKGCLRVWYNNAGKDVTVQFFFENSTVSSLESFTKNIPGLFTIETLESSVLWYIHKPDIEKILDEIGNIPTLRKKMMDTILNRTFNYMQHFLSFIKDTPMQRYLNLLQHQPQIILRVPQHYIASYLGISSVHLSRLKSTLAKAKKA